MLQHSVEHLLLKLIHPGTGMVHRLHRLVHQVNTTRMFLTSALLGQWSKRNRATLHHSTASHMRPIRMTLESVTYRCVRTRPIRTSTRKPNPWDTFFLQYLKRPLENCPHIVSSVASSYKTWMVAPNKVAGRQQLVRIMLVWYRKVKSLTKICPSVTHSAQIPACS